MCYKGFLTRVRPDIVDQTVLLGQSVDLVVSLTSGSNETGQCVQGVGVWDSSTFFVDISDCNLDRCMVLSLDDSVGSRTLSWNV